MESNSIPHLSVAGRLWHRLCYDTSAWAGTRTTLLITVMHWCWGSSRVWGWMEWPWVSAHARPPSSTDHTLAKCNIYDSRALWCDWLGHPSCTAWRHCLTNIDLPLIMFLSPFQLRLFLILHQICNSSVLLQSWNSPTPQYIKWTVKCSHIQEFLHVFIYQGWQSPATNEYCCTGIGIPQGAIVGRTTLSYRCMYSTLQYWHNCSSVTASYLGWK